MQHEGSDRACRRVVGRNAVLLKGCPRIARALVAEPVGENGLVRRFRLLDDGVSGRKIVHDGGWAVHDENGIRPLVLEQRFHGMRVALGTGIADDVDRVRLAPGAWQHLVERGNRFL